jgi:probable HAF family extracellular repeat protein
MIRRGIVVLAAVGAGLLLPASPALAAPAAYRVVDLGTLPGQVTSSAAAINAHGLIVGRSGTQAVLWRDGRIAALSTPAGTSSDAVDVNDRGEIVGDLTDENGNRAFRWRNGRITELPPLPGDTLSFAVAINNRGDVLGSSSGAAGSRPVLWRPDGTTVDLEARTGLSSVNDLDDSGRYVGGVAPDGMNSHPALWADGRVTVLSERFGIASAINGRGAVTGYFVTGAPGSFTWERGRLTDIPMLPGGDEWSFMQSQAISARGLVVGTADRGGFAWDGRTATRLSGLNGNGATGLDVDRRGAIVGWSATTPDGYDEHAVLLLPRR